MSILDTVVVIFIAISLTYIILPLLLLEPEDMLIDVYLCIKTKVAAAATVAVVSVLDTLSFFLSPE